MSLVESIDYPDFAPNEALKPLTRNIMHSNNLYLLGVLYDLNVGNEEFITDPLLYDKTRGLSKANVRAGANLFSSLYIVRPEDEQPHSSSRLLLTRKVEESENTLEDDIEFRISETGLVVIEAAFNEADGLKEARLNRVLFNALSQFVMQYSLAGNNNS